jgi:hypothetical protein
MAIFWIAPMGFSIHEAPQAPSLDFGPPPSEAL